MNSDVSILLFLSDLSGSEEVIENMKKVDGENADTSKFLTIQPTFTINDMAKAEPFMKKCVDLTKTEDGCMFYGWTIKDDKPQYIASVIKNCLSRLVPIPLSILVDMVMANTLLEAPLRRPGNSRAPPEPAWAADHSQLAAPS